MRNMTSMRPGAPVPTAPLLMMLVILPKLPVHRGVDPVTRQLRKAWLVCCQPAE